MITLVGVALVAAVIVGLVLGFAVVTLQRDRARDEVERLRDGGQP